MSLWLHKPLQLEQFVAPQSNFERAATRRRAPRPATSRVSSSDADNTDKQSSATAASGAVARLRTLTWKEQLEWRKDASYVVVMHWFYIYIIYYLHEYCFGFTQNTSCTTERLHC